MAALTVLLYIIVGIAAVWFGFWAIVWIYWFLLGGHKSDKSGDATLGIFFLPFLPFIWLFGMIEDFFRGE